MDKTRNENETPPKTIALRKSENFDRLKQWDRQRARKLMVHRKLIDQLDDSIQQRLRQSQIYLTTLRQFLLDLLTQKVKHEQQTVNNPQNKITNNLAGGHMHRHSSKKLAKLYHLTNNPKGYKKIKTNFEAGLQKMQTLLNDSHKQMTDIRTKIQMQVLQLQHCNERTLTHCNNLVTLYNKTKHTRQYHSDKDMYRQQQEFIYLTFIQTEMQRQLGHQMISYLDYVQQLEKKKLAQAKETIGIYLDGIKDQDPTEQQHHSLLKDILKKQTEDQYMSECYSDGLLSKSVIDQLCTVEGRHRKQLSFQYIKHFLKKFEYTFFEFSNDLILKQYRVFIKLDGELQQVTLLITVDAFLNGYLNKKSLEINNNSKENLHQQIGFSCKIDQSLRMIESGDITLVLQTKKLMKSELYPNINGVELVLANQYQRREFIEYLQKIAAH